MHITFSRLLSGIFVLIPLVFGGCLFFGTIYFIRSTINQITSEVALESATQLAELSRINYLTGNFKKQPKANRPMNNFVYLNKEGAVLGSASNNELPYYRPVTTPMILSRSTKEITVVAPVYLDTTEPNYIQDTTPIGYIGAVFKIEYENIIVSTVIDALMRVSLLLFLITIPLAFFMSNKITKSLTLIVSHIKLASKQDRVKQELRIDEFSKLTEIQAIIKAFNRYIDKLVATQKVNDTLTANLRYEAQQSILEKSEMLAAFSHEMRIPLHVIRSHVHLLVDELPFIESLALSKLFKNRLDTISKSEESILHRVDCILAVCREDSIVPVFERISLKTWLKEFTDAMRPLVDGAGNQFNIKDLSGINVIWSDQKMLEQILMIIIDNACKFTRNGVISFEIKPYLDEKISFVIKDTGSGVSKEIQATIFDPFTRMIANDGVRREGLGLGLYIAKKLTLSLSGRISLKSQCSQGTQFIVTLPIQANSLELQQPTIAIKANV